MGGGGGSSGMGTAGYWVVDIEKMYLGEYWTNRYVVQADTMGDANTVAGLIVQHERQIHVDAVLFTRSRVSDGLPDTDVYQITNVNQFGLSPLAGNQLLPLFCVLRVDFNTEGGGRPSRKYLRGILVEYNQNFNTIDPAAVTLYNTNYVTPMVALAAYVDVDGQAIVSGAAYPFVGMRQLRRGSKRKAPAIGPVPL